MEVKYAFDTYRDIRHGDAKTKVNAVLTFGMRFATAAFIIATLNPYAESDGSMLATAIGGLVVSSVVSTIKLA